MNLTILGERGTAIKYAGQWDPSNSIMDVVMHNATVTFLRVEDGVEMTLSIGGEAVATSASQESIVRELQMHGVAYLVLDNAFSTELPTSERTLRLAEEVSFSEPMCALKLIAACSSMGEVQLSVAKNAELYHAPI